MIEMEDPIALFDEARKQEADAVKREVRFGELTRKLFTTATGKQWLRLALHRCNFMGSVFSAEDGMSVQHAAYRDGMRSVFSDILNSAASGITRQPSEDDE
jgi:hypothetical protein